MLRLQNCRPEPGPGQWVTADRIVRETAAELLLGQSVALAAKEAELEAQQ